MQIAFLLAQNFVPGANGIKWVKPSSATL